MSTETQSNALESAEPLVARDLLRRAKMVLQLVDKDKGSTICTGGLISDISTYLAAPIAAQPDVTQQTLDDVMAGIPARDAEIEALRKEIEALRAKQPVSGADGLTDAAIEMHAKQYDCHNAPGFKGLARAVEVFAQTYGRQEGWQARAALAQQDADKVDVALAEMVHAMFRSANSIPVTRITIDRKQYEATIDAARKEPA